MSNINDFEITKAGKLKRYKGNENTVIVPENVVEVTYPGTFRSPTGGPSSIILPEGLKKISFDAFDDCLNLTEIDIPDSVSHIEPGAIDFRCKIKKINIPANIKQIKGAISECESIWDIIVPDDAVIKEKCWHAFDPNSKIKYCLTNIRRGIELTQTEIAFIKRSFSVAAEMAILHKDTESLSAIFAMKKKVDLDF